MPLISELGRSESGPSSATEKVCGKDGLQDQTKSKAALHLSQFLSRYAVCPWQQSHLFSISLDWLTLNIFVLNRIKICGIVSDFFHLG